MVPLEHPDVEGQCKNPEEFASAVKVWVLDNRLGCFIVGLLVYATVVCLFARLVECWQFYRFQDDKTKLMTPSRLFRFCCLTPLLLCGYMFALFQSSSGCNVSEIYVYCIGAVAPLYDFYELIRRWPLRPVAAAHHLIVAGLLLAHTEWGLLHTQGKPISGWLVLILSNLGLQWSADIFFTVFRFCNSQKIIERARYYYLASGVVRLINTVCFAALCVNAFIDKSAASVLVTQGMFAAYVYESLRGWRWVYRFNVAQYFVSHQEAWLAEDKLYNI